MVNPSSTDLQQLDQDTALAEDSSDSRTRRHPLVQSVDRALSILDTLAEERDGLGVAEISKRVGLNVSTAHRLLATLVARGYARQDRRRKVYRLGLSSLHVGEATRFQLDVRDESMDLLKELAQRVGETVNLVVPSANRAVYVEQVKPGSLSTMQMFTQLGAWVPLHCTAVGKAIMSRFSDSEVEKYIEQEGLPAYTPTTITNPLRFRQELEKVRQCGYAVDDEEREMGVRCTASAILDGQRVVVAAVSISGPSGRITPDQWPYFGQAAHETAIKISRRLGYTGEPTAPPPGTEPPGSTRRA